MSGQRYDDGRPHGDLSPAFLKRLQQSIDEARAKEKAIRAAKRAAKQGAAPTDIEKTKKGRERDTGRYAAENNWNRLCVCGHTLGDHTAASNADDRPCVAADFTGVHDNCQKFRQKRVGGKNVYGKSVATLPGGKDEGEGTSRPSQQAPKGTLRFHVFAWSTYKQTYYVCFRSRSLAAAEARASKWSSVGEHKTHPAYVVDTRGTP